MAWWRDTGVGASRIEATGTLDELLTRSAEMQLLWNGDLVQQAKI